MSVPVSAPAGMPASCGLHEAGHVRGPAGEGREGGRLSCPTEVIIHGGVGGTMEVMKSSS